MVASACRLLLESIKGIAIVPLSLRANKLLVLVVFCVALQSISVHGGSSTLPPSTPDGHSGRTNEKVVLLLDVDNTLYDESLHGIERQIVQNIHSFCAERHGLDGNPKFADDLHHKYGSTVEGLRQTVWKQHTPAELQDCMQDFYDSVYRDVQVRSLLGGITTTGREEDGGSSSSTTATTGYTHQQDERRQLQERLGRFWKSSLQQQHASSIHITSNSPYRHVKRVLHAMGLCRAVASANSWILTPDVATPAFVRRVQHQEQQQGLHHHNQTTMTTNKTSSNSRGVLYPTKYHPRAFLGSLLACDDTKKKRRLVLIDDSSGAREACGPFLDQTIPVNNSNGKNNLEMALYQAMGWVGMNYTFSQVDYLMAKNKVDALAMDSATWRQVGCELQKLVQSERQQQHQTATKSRGSEITPIHIVDVGAGLLSMLRLVLFGHQRQQQRQQQQQPDGDDDGDSTSTSSMPSLLEALQPEASDRNNVVEVHYYAYEPNLALREACMKELMDMRFKKASSSKRGEPLELTFKRKMMTTGKDKSLVVRYHIVVHLRFWDYQNATLVTTQQQQPTPHLIVGCCFADLLQPQELASSLMRSFLSHPLPEDKDPAFNHTLVYFPITFRGITQFLPPKPFERPASYSSSASVPSDTKVFSLYSQALIEQHGHNLDPNSMEEALQDYGAKRLSRGASNWIIDPTKNLYLWETMMYFFGTVVGLKLQEDGWDATGWFDRARVNRPTIHVSNVDLLFQMPHLGHWDTGTTTLGEKDVSSSVEHGRSFEEIQFISPRKVVTVEKEATKLEPNQIRIESVASLISSGTELKIFLGTFDDAALDVNIEGMEDERMQYPLAYGYSLVGRVVECGENVDDGEELIGKLIFTFSAHASQVVIDRSAVQVVPHGISAYDAMFMPSVETALSLVHDAQPRLGEQVAVFGQGLIGILVTAVLGKQQCLDSPSGQFGTVTTVDTIPERLAASAEMGASQALLPSEVSGPFDVAIEISGNGRALQSAIDTTRDGGRIVIGSWYGNSSIDLRLGIDFHRSRKQLKASQVSLLPAELSATWTKSRRFALTWELVRQIRPSRLITRMARLAECQEVYEALESGQEIAVAFEY